MELNLKFAGLLLIGLALIHAFFPRRFGWKAELCDITLLSRQMMYVHTFFIALTIFLMGVLCLTSSADLAATPLGKRVAIGLAIFWLARLVIQFVGYSSELWRGKRFETAMHIVFSVMWIYLSGLFIWVAMS
ncbi:MAG TPA: hypothetical protein VGO43_08070 [Pyrinomonadaceae bacterium]|jgi:hypothetical protein|nr:hypothetical protein [Pyrinomonadaceae bacterium]